MAVAFSGRFEARGKSAIKNKSTSEVYLKALQMSNMKLFCENIVNSL